MSDLLTKEKILNAARVLFADNGFEGTSVREMANLAQVNVASVNYYFSSKEKLFHELLKLAYEECSSALRELLEKNHFQLENTLVDLFRYFIQNSNDLVSHFKMVLSPTHSHKLMTQGSQDGIYGPPGGMILAEVLRKEIPQMSEEDLHWGLKTLFSHVTHLSLIFSTCMKNDHDIPFSNQLDLEKSIRRITRLVISELKSPQHSANSL